jgi:thiol-disulfide isomerase/thioredoxin
MAACAVCCVALLFGPQSVWSQEATDIRPGDAAAPAEDTPEPLTPEAEQAVSELRAALPADSEPIAMLEDILKGSHLGAEDGWFKLAVAQNRYGWDHVQQRYDANADEQVVREEFSGSDADFARLDRNGDKSLTAADFDWSASSLARSPGLMLYFMSDRDANGKVTPEEFSALFNQLDTDGRGFLAVDDLRDQFQPPSGDSREKRADEPSRSTLVLGLQRQEIGSLQAGPSLDEPAPDFSLKSLQGKNVTLSEEVGDRPVVLIFGNFTCGPFRSQAGNIEKLYERYKDRAKFFLIYVREAHPSDGWWMLSNQRVEIDLPQPATNEERWEVAQTCQRHLELDLPFLVDTVDDQAGATYSGMPNRLYLIDREGKVAFKNGRGPFGFKPRELEQALVLLLNE